MRFLAPFLTIALIASTAHASPVISTPVALELHYEDNYYYPADSCCPNCSPCFVGMPLSEMICYVQSRMASPPEELPPSAAVLILKDGTRIVAPDFSIVGSTVWILGKDKASKVALSDVDMDATQRENQLRGVNIGFVRTR